MVFTPRRSEMLCNVIFVQLCLNRNAFIHAAAKADDDDGSCCSATNNHLTVGGGRVYIESNLLRKASIYKRLVRYKQSPREYVNLNNIYIVLFSANLYICNMACCI